MYGSLALAVGVAQALARLAQRATIEVPRRRYGGPAPSILTSEERLH